MTTGSGDEDGNPSVMMDGRLVAWNEATLHVSTHAFLYGTAVFEGVRAYWQEDRERLAVFELDAHLKRLVRNARMIGFEAAPDWRTLRAWTLTVLTENAFRSDVYIRPIIYYGEGGIGVMTTTQPERALVMALPMSRYFETHALAMKTSTWTRMPGNVVPPIAKANGAYVNSYLAVREARAAGFDEALMLNDRGLIAEGSAENLWFVMDGALVTPGVSEDILDGITRTHVKRLARDLDIPVTERPVARTEAYAADEAFVSGTGVEITPVGRIDHVTIGNGDAGPVTARIRERFEATVRGRVPAHAHLLTDVPETTAGATEPGKT